MSSRLEHHRHRCHRSLSRHRGHNRGNQASLRHKLSQESHKGRDVSVSLILAEIPLCKLCHLETLNLVVQRKPLTTYPMPSWLKLLLRLCLWIQQQAFFKYGWAASADKDTPKDDSYSIEYKGIYADTGEAWWAANQPGASVTEVPFCADAPDETCTFRTNVFPAAPAEVRTRYQHQQLDLVAIPRAHLMQLLAATETTNGNGHKQ